MRTVTADIEAQIKTTEPAALDVARQKTTHDLRSYAGALQDLTGLANDPELKAAFAAMGEQVAAIDAKAGDLSPRQLDGLADKLAKVC